MPVISPEKLHLIGCEVMEAAGCTANDARSVVDHLVDSNLFGHDSHGAIRIPEYVKAIKDEGRFKARADVRILRESPCTAVVDNGGALGQVGGTVAMQLAMKKARNTARPRFPSGAPVTWGAWALIRSWPPVRA